ncbi:MAG TPA: hypothetical protein VJS89_08685 [Gammaproteobacteria bacterium]|nr:hypothetical protein [Gammaproteobacteria bacterium]
MKSVESDPTYPFLVRLLKIAMRLLSFKRIVFSDGSSLTYFNREALLYTEQDGHRMEVVWYFNRWFSRGRVVRFTDIDHWMPPYRADIVPTSKRENILSKIIEYSAKKGIALQIEK